MTLLNKVVVILKIEENTIVLAHKLHKLVDYPNSAYNNKTILL